MGYPSLCLSIKKGNNKKIENWNGTRENEEGKQVTVQVSKGIRQIYSGYDDHQRPAILAESTSTTKPQGTYLLSGLKLFCSGVQGGRQYDPDACNT